MVESAARLHCSYYFCPVKQLLLHPIQSPTHLPVRLPLAHCSPHIIIIIIITIAHLALSCTPTLPD